MTKELMCRGQKLLATISAKTVTAIDQGGTYLCVSNSDWYIDTLDKVDYDENKISTITRWSNEVFDSECRHELDNIADYMSKLYEIDYAEFLKNDIIKYKKALIDLNGSL